MSAIFEFIAFVLACIFCFYLPGKLLISKLKLELNSLESIFFSVTFGILFFTFIAYILAWLHMSILLLPVMIVLSVLAIRKKLHLPSKSAKIHKTSIIIVLVCSLCFSLSMLLTGIYGDNIVYRRDDLWHLALINELKAHFPPDNPGIADIPLRGYHFFYDFLLAQISNNVFISPASLHFHFFPLVIALLWGFGVYTFMLRWTGKNSAALWAVFLTMFGGSFMFIQYFMGVTEFSLENGLGIAQPAFSLYNPPLSLSVVIIIFALFSLHQYLTTKKAAWLVPLSLSCALAPMFKVYGGIVLLAGFCALVCLELIKKKFIPLIWLFLTGLVFWGTYWIFVGGTGYLIYFPFWNRDSIFRVLTWFGWDEKITTYTRLDVKRGLIETAGSALGIFLIGNLGTRIIGILLLPLLYLKKRKLPSRFALIMLFMLIVSISFPLFFIQTGKVYEIVQMATYYLFFASLFAALGFGILFNYKFNKIIKFLLVVIIIAATIPSAYATLSSYFSVREKEMSLSNEYFQAMNFLRSQGTYNDTILELPPKNNGTDTRSIAEWYFFSNPAVNAFTNKRSFYNYQYIEFPGVPDDQRVAVLQKIVTASNPKIIEATLKESNIVYIYSQYELPGVSGSKVVKKVFANKAAVIYKVN